MKHFSEHFPVKTLFKKKTHKGLIGVLVNLQKCLYVAKRREADFHRSPPTPENWFWRLVNSPEQWEDIVWGAAKRRGNR